MLLGNRAGAREACIPPSQGVDVSREPVDAFP
jgi:hypothetical protein